MATSSPERKPHLLVRGTAKTQKYKYPKEVRGGGKLKLKKKDRAGHGSKLQHDLAVVRAQLPLLAQKRQAVGIQEDRGVYVEFASDPGFDLNLKSLEKRDRGRAQRHIEMVAVREEASTTFATVFIPEGKLQVFEKLVDDYLTKNTKPTDTRPSGAPKNRTLIESIAELRSAVLRSFWTDDPSEFPRDGQTIWWEVWLRVGADRAASYDDFTSHATEQGLRLSKTKLAFPDRTVCLAYATPERITASVELLDCVAELRKAKELASFFSEMSTSEQGEWAADLADRVAAPAASAPAVCILDSGVSRGHPLIEPGLATEDMHTYDDAWGVADSARWNGHGTGMAGLSLHGDLTDALADAAPRALEHRVESVKIMPPDGFPENDPELY